MREQQILFILFILLGRFQMKGKAISNAFLSAGLLAVCYGSKLALTLPQLFL